MAITRIDNATLIDGSGGAPIRGSKGGGGGRRLGWVGPSAHAPAVGDGAVLDGRGHALLPGMINCHAHLCNDGAADLFAQVVNDTVPIATIRAVLTSPLTIRA